MNGARTLSCCCSSCSSSVSESGGTSPLPNLVKKCTLANCKVSKHDEYNAGVDACLFNHTNSSHNITFTSFATSYFIFTTKASVVLDTIALMSWCNSCQRGVSVNWGKSGLAPITNNISANNSPARHPSWFISFNENRCLVAPPTWIIVARTKAKQVPTK